MYKLLFWCLIAVLFLVKISENLKKIKFWFYLLKIKLYCRPKYLYMERYVQKRGWSRYQYASKIPENNGKLFTHPEMWVHSDFKNKQYGDNGEYSLYDAYLIAKETKLHKILIL